ncbi:phage terminase large subunit [Staphylococcus aureus]|uniref:phage terminase large subunit n=1 Tax=Staphylococcus aureus TaxID=1280 RepID=UPI0020BD9318|nr:phage terminase large subunit [Staphylococcus aureus]
MNITEEQRKAIARSARDELTRVSYKHYIKRVHHGIYEHYPHTELICQYLQRIADGEVMNLIIEIPPRHGKSMTISETFPSYFLMRNPSKKVIAVSYSADLANGFGRLNRNKIDEFGHLFGVKVDRGNGAVAKWTLENNRGGMTATGIGGSVTGKGAHVLIIDDPFKNATAANSPRQRQTVWNEWEMTLSTRLEEKGDGASVIVVMTRWHEDDLVGRLLNNTGRQFQRIRLPAIAEDEDDLLGRAPGTPLCPQLGFTAEWAIQKKIEVGTRTWDALYQQRPSPGEGAMIKRSDIRFYKVLPDNARKDRLTSWDLTFKDAEGADKVSGQEWGRDGANFYLIDRVAGVMDFPATMKAIRSFHAKHRTNRILIEDKANGPAVIASLKNEIPGIIPIEPRGSKIARVAAVSPYWEAGNVYLPDPSIAPWVHDVIEQIVSFPYASNDDDVDAMSQALSQFMMRKVPQIRELG